MIDLHTHTDESDGSCTPAQLIEESLEIGLEALGITDHDTFEGYDKAEPLARAAGLDLVCGIELSTKLRGRSVHLLGYFLEQPPTREFREWVTSMQVSRRDRNVRMVARLRSLGIDITIQEVEALGRSIAGRPHFARIMVDKGYVSSFEQAFDDYLDESAKGYVDRQEPQLEEGIRMILAAGGLPSLPHPLRAVRNGKDVDALISEAVEMGLPALEVYHSDHGPSEVRHYLSLARDFGLAVTGGSDFHGSAKPRIRLGTGANRNLHVPKSVLERLRESALGANVSQGDRFSQSG